MKRITLLLFAVTLATGINAQVRYDELTEEQFYRPGEKYNTWSLTIHYGPVINYTDQIDYTFVPSSEWRSGISGSLAKQLGRVWALEFQYIYTEFYGENIDRYFEAQVEDFYINVTANINQYINEGPIRDKLNVYAKSGIGFTTFRTRQRYLADDSFVRFNEVFTYNPSYPSNFGFRETDFLTFGYAKDDPTREVRREKEFVIPIGLGAKYRINKSFDLGIETAYHYSVSDNWDAMLTGSDNDSYLYTSVNISYKIGKKNKRHARWTYKDLDFAYRAKRKFDPASDKLEQLKNELQSAKEGVETVRSVDTVIVNNTAEVKSGVFESILFFGLNSSEIGDYGYQRIAEVAKYLEMNPGSRLRITGHADERGSDEYNLILSEKRCAIIRDIFVHDFGLDASRFEIEPKGESELLSDTKNLRPDGIHLVNRRVEMKVLNDN